jgi:integrase
MEAQLSEAARVEQRAPSTFNQYRSLLMLCFREAQRVGKVSANPARAIRHRTENNSRVRFLSRVDEKGSREKGEYSRLFRVIREAYPEHLAEFIFAVNTGVRLGSQYAATYEMLDLTRNVLDLPRTKNDEPVHVPLNSMALAAILSLPSSQERKGPIFRNLNHPHKAVLSNDHWFKPALKEAGITDFKWHDLRHTFTSWLVQDGVPLDQVSKLLGHESLMMTMRYAHLAPNQLHEDVARLVATGTPNPPTSAWGRSMLAKRGGLAVQRRYRLEGRDATARATRCRIVKQNATKRALEDALRRESMGLPTPARVKYLPLD